MGQGKSRGKGVKSHRGWKIGNDVRFPARHLSASPGNRSRSKTGHSQNEITVDFGLRGCTGQKSNHGRRFSRVPVHGAPMVQIIRGKVWAWSGAPCSSRCENTQ